MKNLISKLLFSVIILTSQTVFAGNLDKKDSIEKINRIKFSIDSVIKSELGNLTINPEFDFISHTYTKKYIDGGNYEKFNGCHLNAAQIISNDLVSVEDIPISEIVESFKNQMNKVKAKEWDFKRYTIVFGEYKGKSYLCISIDY